ncbi:WD40 repeat domain-containing protein [Singulisphaera rosea]
MGVSWRDDGAPHSLVLSRHTCGIRAIAGSAASRQVAWIGWDGTIARTEWDAFGPRTTILERELEGGPSTLAFSPDGTCLALGCEDGSIEVFDNANDRLYLRFDSGGRGVKCVGYSPDGRVLATGNLDSRIRLWDPGTGRLLATFPGHKSAVSRIAFDDSGARLASADIQGRVLIRDWRVSSTIDEWAPAGRVLDDVLALEFSRQEDSLVFARRTQPLVFLRNPSQGFVKTTDLLGTATTAFVPSRTDQGLVVGDRRGHVEVWDPLGVHRRRTWKAHQGGVTALAYSSNGRSLISAGQDGIIRLWATAEDRQTDLASTVSEFE